MTSLPDQARRLAAAIASGELQGEARSIAVRALERLSAPVRVGILGPEMSALLSLANGLLERDVLPIREGMPPVRLRGGAQECIELTTVAGSRHVTSPEAFGGIDPWGLAMAEFTAPLPLLEDLSLLVVPLEGTAEEEKAAISWAAQRCDMAVFYAMDADPALQKLWSSLPQPLTDHGFLCLPEAAATLPPSGSFLTEHPFRALHRIEGPENTKQFAGLRSALLNHIASARSEDLQGTLLFLERYGYQAQAEAGVSQDTLPTQYGLPDFSDLLDQILPVQEKQLGREDTSASASEIVSFLAAQADELACLCETAQTLPSGKATADVLALCAESIEACGEIAMRAEPEITETVNEASDLIVLMQIESSAEAMSDAVALMLQLRHECEARLCA